MCGITGVFRPGDPPEDAELSEMSDCLVHRGPDEGGIVTHGPVGLAHRRLSIIDPTGGRQPIYNEDGSVVVVFNGEIYNYQSLRANLQDRGHEFQTDTDTEVLVHLYEEDGPEFVSRLEGMFAFALWDDDDEQLHLARDRMGIKPLYISDDDDGVAFGSELDALLRSQVDHGSLDEDGLSEYFAFGQIPAPKTAFANASKLEPGERAVVERTGVERTQYYDPSVISVGDSFGSAVDALRERVRSAVEKRLMADVPLGAFLSGGIDSSIVVGVMSELTDDPVKTFTVGFTEEQFDETWAAETVARHHDTDHHEFTVSPDEVRALVPSVVGSLGEPFADPSILPTYVVARETSEEVTVALSGDGADELFSGYNKYRGEYVSRYYRVLPAGLRKRFVEPVVDRLPASRATRCGELSRKGQEFVRTAGSDARTRQYQWMAVTTVETANSFLRLDPIVNGENRFSIAHEKSKDVLPDGRRDDLAVMRTTDAWFGLPDGILHKVDTASMLNSLEVRTPFLDTDVVEYAMGLPTSFSITRSERKRVLKSAFRDYLPEKILSRKKQGFDMPIGEWFKDELSTDFQETLETVETDVVDRDAVGRIYEEHVEGTQDHTQFLWTVYVFLLWIDRMEREGHLEP